MTVPRAIRWTLAVATVALLISQGDRLREWRYDILLDRENLRQARAQFGNPGLTMDQLFAIRAKSDALWQLFCLPHRLRLVPVPGKPVPTRDGPTSFLRHTQSLGALGVLVD